MKEVLINRTCKKQLKNLEIMDNRVVSLVTSIGIITENSHLYLKFKMKK
jgi:hypothetical protein